jgi:hypothetical protein
MRYSDDVTCVHTVLPVIVWYASAYAHRIYSSIEHWLPGHQQLVKKPYSQLGGDGNKLLLWGEVLVLDDAQAIVLLSLLL